MNKAWYFIFPQILLLGILMQNLGGVYNCEQFDVHATFLQDCYNARILMIIVFGLILATFNIPIIKMKLDKEIDKSIEERKN